MNKRIKELTHLAFNEVRNTVDINDPAWKELLSIIVKDNTVLNEFKEKFAELIVRECISKCEFVADMATITNKGEMARKTKATADSCAKMIKEHFGV